jgi:hypothetical protein
MLKKLPRCSWICVVSFCCLGLLTAFNFGFSQAPSDKKAELSDQDKLRQILNRYNKQQRDETPLPNPKASAAAEAASRIADVSKNADAFRQWQAERDRSASNIIRSVERSGLTVGDEITYPKDWKERTQVRASSLVQMTPKERTILRTLDSSMSLDLKRAGFESVIDYLRTKTGLPILLDSEALKQADVTYESTVSVTLKDASVRLVLKKILGDLGLTYVIRNETVMVVTPGMAKQMMVTRAYYIRDLLPAGYPFLSALQAGALIDMIQSTVQPQSWKANGGDGTIDYDPVRRALIVKQSAEFQSVLSGAAP